jgi:DNA replication protein DnaC
VGRPPRDARAADRLHEGLRRLGRYPLLVIDEVGYMPFEPEAANQFFQLVSARYERASLDVQQALRPLGARSSPTTSWPPP